MVKKIFPCLNGLRAISIIIVIIYHLRITYHLFENLFQIKWLQPFLFILQDGLLGVSIFFVISGFLITSLLLQEEEKRKTISLKKFYIRRTLRIFPAYFFLLGTYFILQTFNLIHISPASWLTALTFTKYFNWNLDRVTRHLWSLSIEEHFYFIWPLIFLCGKKLRKIAVIAIILIVPCLRIFLRADFYQLTIFTRIDSIATGCLFALYKDIIIAKMSAHWRKLFYLCVVVLIFLRYLPIAANKIHLAFVFIPLGSVHGTIANFLIALIMMYFVFGPQKGWFKILNFRPISYIGMLSYSLYLWQQIFISNLNLVVTQFPQNLIFIIMMALFSHYLIEKPFLKLKSKFSEV